MSVTIQEFDAALGPDTQIPEAGSGSVDDNPLLGPLRHPIQRTIDAVVAIGVFLLTSAMTFGFSSNILIGHDVILLILGAVGLPILVVLAIGRHQSRNICWAARSASAFLVVAGVSTVISVSPALTLVGPYDQGGGTIFFAAVAGAWALSSTVSNKGRINLEVAVIAGAALNAGVAIVQQVTARPIFGNSAEVSGTLGNPVFLGALLAASLVLLADRVRQDGRRWGPVLLLITIGLGVCSERLPLICALVVVAWEIRNGLAKRHENGSTVRASVLFGSVVIAGVLAGTWIASLRKSGVVNYQLADSASGTYQNRLTAWLEGARAVAERPLFGFGLGQYRGATSQLFSKTFVLSAKGSIFTDGHNLFVDVAVGTGLVGLAFFVGWLLFAIRGTGGILLGCSALLFVSGMVEPIDVVTTPLAFITLGAAGSFRRYAADPQSQLRGNQIASSQPSDGQISDSQVSDSQVRPDRGRSEREVNGRVQTVVVAAVALCFSVATLASAALLLGDHLYLRSGNDFDLAMDSAAISDANTAEKLLSPWPEPAEMLSKIYLYESIGGGKSISDQAVYWAQVAADRDPTNASLWAGLSGLEIRFKEYSQAAVAARLAEKYAPYTPAPLEESAIVALAQKNYSAEEQLFRQILEIDPTNSLIRNIEDGKCKVTASTFTEDITTGLCRS